MAIEFGALTFGGPKPISAATTRQREGFGATNEISSQSEKLSHDPRGSLFDGFDISGWNGSPVYGAGERKLDFLS